MANIKRMRINEIIAEKKKLTAREKNKLDRYTKKILEGKSVERITVSEDNILQDGYILYLAYLNICKDMTIEVNQTTKNS